MDGLVEGGDVCEGLVGEVMGLEIAPDRLDFIEFGGVFRHPLDGEPVCAGGHNGARAFASSISCITARRISRKPSGLFEKSSLTVTIASLLVMTEFLIRNR